MRMIAYIWPKINSDLPFTTMKTILLERFSPRTTDCLESFSAAQRGDDTVTKYLVRLQTPLITQATRTYINFDSHADNILARKKLITAISPIADSLVSQNQAVINQMLESRLDKLDCTLSSCHHLPRQPVENRRHKSGHAFSRARGDHHPSPKAFASPSHCIPCIPIITTLSIMRLNVRVLLALCTLNIRQKTANQPPRIRGL